MLQLEFKVIPPEFPEYKDLFARLVRRLINLLTTYIAIGCYANHRDHCLLSLLQIIGKHLAV